MTRVVPFKPHLCIGIVVESVDKIVEGSIAEKINNRKTPEQSESPIQRETPEQRGSPLLILIVGPILTGIILTIGVLIYFIFNQTLEGIDFLNMFMYGFLGFAIGVLICLCIKAKNDD